MRIVLSTYGTEGDHRPVAALGAHLAGRGHDVLMLAGPAGQAAAEAAGLPFTPLSEGGEAPAGGHALAISSRAAPTRGDHTRRLLRTSRSQGATWLRQIHTAARSADVVVGSSLTWTQALTAARGLGIVAVGAGFQPTLPTRDFAPPLLGMPLPRVLRRPAARAVLGALHVSGWASLRGTAAELGCPPPHGAPPDVLLGAWSPTLVPTPADWPQDAVCVTGEWYDDAAGWVPSPELAGFLADGEPPVYVGLGSLGIPRGTQGVAAELRAALNGRRVIVSGSLADLLSAGPGTAPGASPRHDGILRVGHVPHSWLFPRCAAIVHHCGAGTSHAAARSGTPSLPLPVLADQHFWAARLAALGAGTRPLPWRGLTANHVREALDAASTLRADSRAIAARMATEHGVEAAAAAIQRLRGL